MSQETIATLVHFSGRYRGQTQRLSGETIHLGLDGDHVLHATASPLADGVRPVGRLIQRGDTYQLQVAPEAKIWLNGETVQEFVLASGDVLEIGKEGPVLRFRLYPPGSKGFKTIAQVFSDCVACVRYGGEGLFERSGILMSSMARELATQTTPTLRWGLLLILVVLSASTVVLWRQNLQLREDIALERARLQELSELLAEARQNFLNTADLARTRRDVEAQIAAGLARIEELESEREAPGRIIETAARSVVLLQGAYSFRDDASGRILKFRTVPSIPPPRAGEPPVTLDGNGPPVEIPYTGSGFVVSGNRILTNRHVALPWVYEETAQAMQKKGFSAVMSRFVGFLPGRAEPFEVNLLRASDSADVAVLRCSVSDGAVVALDFASAPPRAGENVLVLGYPAGIQALVARAGQAFVEEVTSNPLDFWQLARRLSSDRLIAPLATLGIVGQVTPNSIVYDAETTHGGSGGPVLNLKGEVVAVNAAILPQFGGSNLGVPAAEALKLLASAPR